MSERTKSLSERTKSRTHLDKAGKAPAGNPPLLTVESLRVSFRSTQGPVEAVRGVSFEVNPGETLGIVGESGSGKTLSALATLDLVPPPGQVTGGIISWRGRPVVASERRAMRGRNIAMVFQDPVATLNPLMTVGAQIAEVIRRHRKASRKEALRQAVELLDMTGIPYASKRARQFPFEFSGGMAQRAMIAIALAAEPELLIADEPTSALDVTIQAQVLQLIRDLQDRLGIAMVLISHNLGVVASTCDRVVVMYGGQVMETGPVAEVLGSPRHPYTVGLLASTPRLDRAGEVPTPIAGYPMRPGSISVGCPFAPRCGRASNLCVESDPPMTSFGAAHASCWHPFS